MLILGAKPPVSLFFITGGQAARKGRCGGTLTGGGLLAAEPTGRANSGGQATTNSRHISGLFL